MQDPVSRPWPTTSLRTPRATEAGVRWVDPTPAAQARAGGVSSVRAGTPSPPRPAQPPEKTGEIRIRSPSWSSSSGSIAQPSRPTMRGRARSMPIASRRPRDGRAGRELELALAEPQRVDQAADELDRDLHRHGSVAKASAAAASAPSPRALQGRPGRDAARVVATNVVVVLEHPVVLLAIEDHARDRPFGVGVGRVEPGRRREVGRAVRVRELAQPEELHERVDPVGDRPEVLELPVACPVIVLK